MNTNAADAVWFRRRLLHWFDRHGRTHLPWQARRNRYRVWVSEIMLQQTQVTTVIPYYRRFMERFPNIASLASAHVDDVLELWAGLGYYARGRNLHRCATTIRDRYRGRFPGDPDTLQNLPGIGRSTAAAILALADNKPLAILDGNVKRVLCRFHAVDGWPGDKTVENRLWEYAEQYTARKRARDYTQAIMDRGATVCTRSRPACHSCPIKTRCAAYARQRVADYPVARSRKPTPLKQTTMLLVRDHRGAVLLEKRPPTGIWGGLWSLPECPHQHDEDIRAWCRDKLGLDVRIRDRAAVMRHVFSHFRLDITPVNIITNSIEIRCMDDDHFVWYNADQNMNRAMARPVQRLLHADLVSENPL